MPTLEDIEEQLDVIISVELLLALFASDDFRIEGGDVHFHGFLWFGQIGVGGRFLDGWVNK